MVLRTLVHTRSMQHRKGSPTMLGGALCYVPLVGSQGALTLQRLRSSAVKNNFHISQIDLTTEA